MRNSLSLALYRLTMAQHSSGAVAMERPDNAQIVWVAAHDVASARAFINLAPRLHHAGLDVTLLITAPDDVLDQLKPEAGVILSAFPSEKGGDAKAFVSLWRPIIGFWVGVPLYPALIQAAAHLDVPMVLLNVSEDIKPEGVGIFHAKAIAQTVRSFHMAFANSFVSGGMCVHMGMSEEAVQVAGPLAEGSVVLKAEEHDLERMSDSLRGRDVWLAANVPDSEIDYVLAAHEVLRSTNRRLLLILNPADPSQAETLAIALAEKGWRTAIHSKGDALRGQTQIFLADNPHELGLWYRLAPISFIGGTLVIDGNGRDPLEAAALGSAIVHGPRTNPHRDSYGQLHNLTPPAATQIIHPEHLARAVSELLSPDVAAAQANSAWEFVSRGAELTDQIVELIIEASDMAEVAHA